MGYLKCKNCGSNSFRKIDKDSYECKYCGILLRKKFATIKEEEKKTSVLLDDFNEDKKIQSKQNSHNFAVVKLLLCIFLGYYGVHRFVEGKIGTGLLFLFTYGLFGIGYICDIFRLVRELSDSNKSHSDTSKEGES